MAVRLADPNIALTDAEYVCSRDHRREDAARAWRRLDSHLQSDKL